MPDTDKPEPNEPMPLGQILGSASATQPNEPPGLASSQDPVPNTSKLSLHSERGIEEGYDVYKPGGFHPVHIGDIYNGKYLVISKLGYGLYSTVWLIRDTMSR